MSKDIKDQVAERLEEIRDMTHDPERAHSAERDLWRTVLEMAAAGCEVAGAAKEALKTEDVDFPRWFA